MQRAFIEKFVFLAIIMQLIINALAGYVIGVQTEKIGQLEDMVFNGGYDGKR